MSVLKTKLKKILNNKSPSVKPCQVGTSKKKFCNRQIHDPLFDCCCDYFYCNNKFYRENAKNFDAYGDYNNDGSDGLCLASDDVVPENNRFIYRKNSISSTNNNTIKTAAATKNSTPKSSNKKSRAQSRASSSLSKRSPSIFNLNLHELKGPPRFLLNPINRGKDCDYIESSRLNTFRSLCDKFENTYITPKLSKIYAKIPNHDKRILNRMALKRTKNLALAEDAKIAHKFWDDERTSRQIFINQQAAVYSNILRNKRIKEQTERDNRIAYLQEQERAQRDKLKREIEQKHVKVNCRIKNLELKRELELCEKRHEDFKKFDEIAAKNSENSLDEVLRRQECYDKLERKLNHADYIKGRILQAYKTRLEMDNHIEKYAHKSNLEEVKRHELYQRERLRDSIFSRNKKYLKFVEQKNKKYEESRIQARTTADLRDLIRNSITPDNMTFRVPQSCRASTYGDRPPSNMSFLSHVKLG